MKEIDCKMEIIRKGDNVTVNIVKGNVTPGVAITTYASALINEMLQVFNGNKQLCKEQFNDLVELFDTINDKEWN